MSRSLEATELSEQIAELTKAGVPLAEGLRAMSEEFPRGRLGRSLSSLAAQLESGANMEQAIVSSAKRLPEGLRKLLVVGVRSGHLPQTLDELARQQRVADELRRIMWQKLSYPILLLIFLCVWFLFVARMLVLPMEKIYNDFGTSLPTITHMAISMAHGIPVVLGVMLGVVAVGAVIRLIFGVSILSYCITFLPFVGPLARNRGLAEFAGLLRIFVREKLPMAESLRLTASGIASAPVARGCRLGARRVEAGQSLSESLRRQWPFPPTLYPILENGERQDSLPESLDNAMEWFHDRMETQSRLLYGVFPPLLFILVVGAIGFICLGLFLPMLHLMVDLSK